VLDRHGEADEEKTVDLLRYSASIVAMADGEPDDTSPRMRSSAITSRKQMRDPYGTCTGNGGEMPRCIPACRSPNGARRSTTLQSISNSLRSPPLHMLANGEASRIGLTKGRRSIVLHGFPTSRC
jgi:hypothetical protein